MERGNGGVYVPVTMYLPKSTQILEYIDIKNYLPKNEYLYGTDFTIAKKELNKILDNRQKCPSGWWENNNGKLFCLPYEHSHRLPEEADRANE